MKLFILLFAFFSFLFVNAQVNLDNINDIDTEYTWVLQTYMSGTNIDAHAIVMARAYIGAAPTTFSGSLTGKFSGAVYSIDLVTYDANAVMKGTLTTRINAFKKISTSLKITGAPKVYTGTFRDVYTKVGIVSTGIYANGKSYFVGGKVTGVGVNCRDYASVVMNAF